MINISIVPTHAQLWLLTLDNRPSFRYVVNDMPEDVVVTRLSETTGRQRLHVVMK